MMRAAIAATGAELPAQCVTSEALERSFGLEAGWIEQRTGIAQRRIASDLEATSDLAIRAGHRALETADVSRNDVALLLLATSTPDHPLPPTAPRVAHELGLASAGAVDLAAACAGFLYALTLAEAFCLTHHAPVMVIGANVLSRRTNPDDLNTSVLFADGAGSALIEPTQDDRGILATQLGAEGKDWDDLLVPAGGSRIPLSPQNVAEGDHLMCLRRGGSVFRHAVNSMASAGRSAIERAGTTADDLRWWIPHQASRRIIEETRRKLGVSPERTAGYLSQLGNSSAATVPIALALLNEQRKIDRGDLLLLTAAGAGYVSGAAVVRW